MIETSLTWPEAIKEYRRRRGTVVQPYPRVALAAELGISIETLKRYERGSYRPRKNSLIERTLRAVCGVYGIEIEETVPSPRWGEGGYPLGDGGLGDDESTRTVESTAAD